MNICTTCFKEICRCHHSHKIDIDYYIYPAIYEFNRKGYRTVSCCSGHTDDGKLKTYIEFREDHDFSFTSDFVQFDTYNYNGIHVRKNFIKPVPEIITKFKKKRTDKESLIRSINRDLYRIAQEVPYIEQNIKIEERVFQTQYFDRDNYIPEIPDLQKPWILILPNSRQCQEYIDQYLDTISKGGILYELVLNDVKSQKIHRVSSSDFSSSIYEKNSTMLKQVEYDICSNPEAVLLGQEKDMQLEIIEFDADEWLLYYVILSTDDDFYHEGHTSPIGITDDIVDYKDDNSGLDLIRVFEYGFSLLIKKNINICAFSSGQTVVIFSNGIDFAYSGSSLGSAFQFGKIDYDDTELKHMRVTGRECFIIVNGTLLSRKELKTNVGK